MDELPVRRLHPKTRLIMTYRDPKGAAVSQFHFYKKHLTLGVSPDLTLDQFVDLFLEGDLYSGTTTNTKATSIPHPTASPLNNCASPV